MSISKMDSYYNVRLMIWIFFLICFTVCAGFSFAQPTILAPTQTDEIIIDNGATGKADPNDRIRYKVTIQNTGITGATGTQLNIVPDPRTTFVAGTFRSSPLALADSYASTGNVGLNIPVASGLKANDFDDNIPGLTITAGTFTTTQGGSIMISADGSFMYTPVAGFTGSDTYTYTLNDANGVGGGVPATDMAVVTITVSNLIWFIDNSSVAATSDGRLTSPFKSLADFNVGSATVGDLTYIEHTGTNYTGGIVLQDNERVYGEGHTGAANLSGVLPFTLAPNSKMLPNINGTRPIITNASGDGVTLAQNNNLRGFDVGNCSDFGMDNSGANSIGNLVVSEVAITNTTGGGFDASNGSGASTNAVFSSISSTGGVNGIDLVSCAGTFTVNGGTITNPTGTGVLISGGSVVFSSSGVITDNTGFAVDVDNHDSGNVTFSGNITSTATGIRVQNCGGGTKTFSGSSKSLNTATNNAVSLLSNAGATITISNGGLVISTTSGVGFNATGGAAAINVTGTGNTITTTTGTALNVVSTTIGGSNLNFLSISANGAPNGINLNSTGAGGLIVSGDGGGSNNNSGGIIQNTTSHGVSLNTVANVRLNYMGITNNLGSGISGPTINGFQLNRCNITGNGNDAASDESGINVTGLTGSAIAGSNPTSITNCIISNNNEFELQITNSAGTLTDLQMSGNTISSNGLPINGNGSSPHGNLVNFLALGNANMKTTVTSSSFIGNWNPTSPPATITATAMQCDHSGTSGTMTANISGCTFTNNNVGPQASVAGGGKVLFDFNNNTITGSRAIGINFFADANPPFTKSLEGKVVNNIIGIVDVTNSGAMLGNGIRIQNEGAVPITMLIDGNTIQEVQSFPGINLNAGLSGIATGGQLTSLTITNNIIRKMNGSRAITLQDNQNAPNTPAPTICVNMSGNIMSDIFGQAGDGTYVRLRRLNGDFNVTQASMAALEAANTCTGGCAGKFTYSGTIDFGQPVCPLPSN